MTIYPVFQPLTIAEWIAFDRQHSAPTFQARPPWALALAAENPRNTPAPLRVDVSADLATIVPLVRTQSGRLKWRVFEGTPLDGHDVILSTNGTLVDGPALTRVLAALRAWNSDSLTLNFWPLLSVASIEGWSSRRFDASIVDLREGPDAALARMDGKSRRMAGQAERRGVVCVLQTDAAAIDSYYDLLVLSSKRWGKDKPIVSKTFLRSLVEHGGADVEIWLARYEGTTIAGLIGLYGTHECYVWSAVMDPDKAVLRPHNLLHLRLIQAAAARGMQWYNLGSSEGLPNVKRFKDGLGADTVPYERFTLEKGAYRVYRKLRGSRAPT